MAELLGTSTPRRVLLGGHRRDELVEGCSAGSCELSQETSDIASTPNNHPVTTLQDVDEVRDDAPTVGLNATLRRETPVLMPLPMYSSTT